MTGFGLWPSPMINLEGAVAPPSVKPSHTTIVRLRPACPL